MATIASIIILFGLASLLPLIEDYMGKYRIHIYVFMGMMMILVAGLREVGVDPDSLNYEEAYLHYDFQSSEDSKEFTFIILSELLNKVTNDVHALFLIYAFIAVVLHLIAFRQLSEYWFLPLLVYVSFYFVMHEMIQIRTGVLSGFFMLAIKPIAEKRRFTALLLILAGTTFHLSGLALIPLIFLSNKPLTGAKRWFWMAIIPVGYVVYTLGVAATMYLDIPFIGQKLMEYQSGDEKGQSIVTVNAFNVVQLLSIAAFYYLMCFHDTIIEKNKYFPLMMKLFALGTAIFAAFSFFPIIGDRIGYQIKMINIILFANIFYTIVPKWMGRIAIFFVSSIQLVYILSYAFIK